MYVECLTSSLTVIVILNFAHDLTSTDSNAHGVFFRFSLFILKDNATL